MFKPSASSKVAPMTKAQRLRMTAEGFMAGLVTCGYEGPWRWNNLDWELPFYRVWREWPPQQRTPNSFPRFELGGHGRTSEAREMLWQLKSTSPFHQYRDQPLPKEPLGLSPHEYLEILADAASPAEWVALAEAFLDNIRIRE